MSDERLTDADLDRIEAEASDIAWANAHGGHDQFQEDVRGLVAEVRALRVEARALRELNAALLQPEPVPLDTGRPCEDVSGDARCKLPRWATPGSTETSGTDADGKSFAWARWQDFDDPPAIIRSEEGRT